MNPSGPRFNIVSPSVVPTPKQPSLVVSSQGFNPQEIMSQINNPRPMIPPNPDNGMALNIPTISLVNKGKIVQFSPNVSDRLFDSSGRSYPLSVDGVLCPICGIRIEGHPIGIPTKRKTIVLPNGMKKLVYVLERFFNSFECVYREILNLQGRDLDQQDQNYSDSLVYLEEIYRLQYPDESKTKELSPAPESRLHAAFGGMIKDWTGTKVNWEKSPGILPFLGVALYLID